MALRSMAPDQIARHGQMICDEMFREASYDLLQRMALRLHYDSSKGGDPGE